MASSYGKGPYGNRLYSLAPTADFDGDLAPQVNFAADKLDVLVVQGDLAGNLRPLIVLSASLTVDRVFAGNFAPGIVFAANAVFGPYWMPSESCPPPLWTPVGPCASVGWKESVDG